MGLDNYSYPSGSDKPERGGCLTAWLVVSTILTVIAGVAFMQLLSVLIRPRAFEDISPVGVLLLGGLMIGSSICLIGVWNWKRWGVYGIALTSCISPLIEVFFFRADVTDFIAPFVQIAILWYLVSGKWDAFD
jgi:hypothetical protein